MTIPSIDVMCDACGVGVACVWAYRGPLQSSYVVREVQMGGAACWGAGGVGRLVGHTSA